VQQVRRFDDTDCNDYIGKDFGMRGSSGQKLIDLVRSCSLRWQIVGLCGIAFLPAAAGAVAVFSLAANETSPDLVQSRALFVVLLLATASLLGVAFLAGRLLRPLHDIRHGMGQALSGRFDLDSPSGICSQEFSQLNETFREMARQIDHARTGGDDSRRILAKRTQTVDRLLEFSQTIQGAGKAEQAFQTLSFFLQAELGLAGIAILSINPEATPTVQVKASWPNHLLAADRVVGEIDSSVCPCLRQNMPKLFACSKSPIRCSIDNILSLSTDHPAFCIPFNLRKSQCVVHMLLPIGTEWTDERRQLAQTYINTAHSTLMSLHLLAEAETQSLTDVLTGLYNRRSLESLLQREVALAERHGHALTVVMIDMDKFKEVNDTFGHAAGDFMLRAFADCVRMTLRKTDLAFRYGGDEFCIALPQTPIEQAQQVVQKLRQAYMSVDFSDAIAKLDQQPTLSIGLAERTKPTVLTLQSLLAAADAALYDAKNSSRNCIKLFTPPQAA
jgi:diguanylate cyclase (GGDEF)-like protein